MKRTLAIALAFAISLTNAAFAAPSSPSPQQIQDTLNLLIDQPVEVTLRSGERKSGTLKVVTAATVAIELRDGSMAIVAPGDVVGIRRLDPTARPAEPTAPQKTEPTWPAAEGPVDTTPTAPARPVRDPEPDARPVRDAPTRRRPSYDGPKVNPQAAASAKRLAEVQADARFDFTAALVAVGVGTAAGLGAGLVASANAASVGNGGSGSRDATVLTFGLGAISSVSGLVATIFAIKGGIETFEAAELEAASQANK